MVPNTARPVMNGQLPFSGFSGTRFTASRTPTMARATMLRKKAFSAVGTSPASRMNTVIMEKPKAANSIHTIPLTRGLIFFIGFLLLCIEKTGKHPGRDAFRAIQRIVLPGR